MPDTAADIGFNSQFGIKGSGSTYAMVAEVTAITAPGFSRDAIDATHLKSPDKYKEYIAGLMDLGDASITINFVPSASDTLMAAFVAGKGEFRILFPSGTVALDFKGIVTGYEIGELTTDKMSATLTIKGTGKAALTAVSAG
ncbi:phage tail tube protein [Falsigemmobacter faecalis]|uniref:Outer capsid protein Hoc n=1 Tax=Falsigemmobacter faecalis TaxID=2488730 RepID=A0A3P3D6I2_9RHOB|nr:phage tail tube protein [Falsigemmobacter faecalis]RRH69967.1 outer capsid protein Hoc [Falsigemmobacter faecalis]